MQGKKSSFQGTRIGRSNKRPRCDATARKWRPPDTGSKCKEVPDTYRLLRRGLVGKSKRVHRAFRIPALAQHRHGSSRAGRAAGGRTEGLTCSRRTPLFVYVTSKVPSSTATIRRRRQSLGFGGPRFIRPGLLTIYHRSPHIAPRPILDKFITQTRDP